VRWENGRQRRRHLLILPLSAINVSLFASRRRRRRNHQRRWKGGVWGGGMKGLLHLTPLPPHTHCIAVATRVPRPSAAHCARSPSPHRVKHSRTRASKTFNSANSENASAAALFIAFSCVRRGSLRINEWRHQFCGGSSAISKRACAVDVGERCGRLPATLYAPTHLMYAPSTSFAHAAHNVRSEGNARSAPAPHSHCISFFSSFLLLPLPPACLCIHTGGGEGHGSVA